MIVSTLVLAAIVATVGAIDPPGSCKKQRKKQKDDPFNLNPRNQQSSFFSPDKFNAASRASFQARRVKWCTRLRSLIKKLI